QTDSPSKPLPNLAREERKGETHCTEADVLAFARKDPVNGGAPAYVCQATQVPAATKPLPWSEWRQYVEVYSSGNVTLARMAKSFVYMAYVHGLVNLGI